MSTDGISRYYSDVDDLADPPALGDDWLGAYGDPEETPLEAWHSGGFITTREAIHPPTETAIGYDVNGVPDGGMATQRVLVGEANHYADDELYESAAWVFDGDVYETYEMTSDRLALTLCVGIAERVERGEIP